MKPLIENIELIRKAKNLSREIVASKLNLTENNYGKIERGEIGLTLDRLYELAGIFKMQPEEILTYSKPKKGNISYVPFEAQADFLTGREEENLVYKTYNLPFIQGKNLFMVDAPGDSMSPAILSGDKIVIERLKDLKLVQYGRMYIVVTESECVIERIYSHKNPKKLILKADNPTYEPYEINRNDVIAIWVVKNYLLRINPALSSSFVLAEGDRSL